MNLELLEAFFGKRFSGLLICAGALVIGYFWGDPAVFPTFATTVGGMYSVFVLGQSYTDAKEK